MERRKKGEVSLKASVKVDRRTRAGRRNRVMIAEMLVTGIQYS